MFFCILLQFAISTISVVNGLRCSASTNETTATSKCASAAGTMQLHILCTKPGEVISISSVCYGYLYTSSPGCLHDALADCRVEMDKQQYDYAALLAACDERVMCNTEVYQKPTNSCGRSTRNSDYVVVVYRCAVPAIPSTTQPATTHPSTASSTLTTGNYNRTSTLQWFPDKTTTILIESTQTSEKQLQTVLASHRDVITIGVGGLLVLVIVILTIVVCRRKRQSAAVGNGRGRHKQSIASCNYYSPVDPLTPDVTSFPSSPMYAVPHEIEMRFNVTDGRQPTVSQYLPMEGKKNNSQLIFPSRLVEDTSAYVFEDHSASKGQQREASVSVPTDYKHQLNPAPASDFLTPRFTKPHLNSVNSTTDKQQRQPVNAADNCSVMYALSKPKPAVNRRKNTGSTRQRPASTDLLFDHASYAATGLYEEIPADFMSLPIRQHSSSRLKYRPQPPTPDSPSMAAVTDRPTAAAPLRRTRTRRRTESDNNQQQVWYSCSDVTLLGPVDMLDGPNVAAVKPPEVEEIGKMQRKSSYDASDTILIESAIYG